MLMKRLAGIGLAVTAAVALMVGTPAAMAAESAAQISTDAKAALARLEGEVPAAKHLAKEAKAILVFPAVVKGGFMIGGEYGNGALLHGRKTLGYYNIAGVSYGLQAGAQSFGYALFFMTESALRYLQESGGWEIGAGPSVVVMDEGLAKSITTTTARGDVYAFVFGQSGLMAGAGLQGSKITRIQPEN